MNRDKTNIYLSLTGWPLGCGLVAGDVVVGVVTGGGLFINNDVLVVVTLVLLLFDSFSDGSSFVELL